MSYLPESQLIELEIIKTLGYENAYIDELLNSIEGFHFYNLTLGEIFRRFKKGYLNSEKPSLNQVLSTMVENKFIIKDSAKSVLNEIIEYKGVVSTVDQMIYSIVNSYAKRETMKVASEAINSGTKVRDANELISGLQTKLDSISKGLETNSIDFDEILDNYKDKINNPSESNLVPCGISWLDNHIPYTRGTLEVIVANPGGGKTSLAINVALKRAVAKQRVALFICESNTEAILTRIVAMFTGVEQRNITNPTSDEELKVVNNVINGLKNIFGKYLFIYGSESFKHNVDDINLKMSQLEKKYGKFTQVFVDHIQRLDAPSDAKKGDENQKVSMNIISLQKMAIKYDCVMSVLSQINKGYGGKITKNRLRGSSAIVEEAHHIITLTLDESTKYDTYKKITIECIKSRDFEGFIIDVGFLGKKLLFEGYYTHLTTMSKS